MRRRKCLKTNGLLWAAYGVVIASLPSAYRETSTLWIWAAAGVLAISVGLLIWRRVTNVTGDC